MVLEYHKHHSNTDLTFEHSVAALIASILTSCSSSHNSRSGSCCWWFCACYEHRPDDV